jgi:hypothetical protein
LLKDLHDISDEFESRSKMIAAGCIKVCCDALKLESKLEPVNDRLMLIQSALGFLRNMAALPEGLLQTAQLDVFPQLRTIALDPDETKSGYRAVALGWLMEAWKLCQNEDKAADEACIKMVKLGLCDVYFKHLVHLRPVAKRSIWAMRAFAALGHLFDWN